MFYKFLIENSTKKFKNYEVRGVLHFVEPVDGEIETLEIAYDDKELEDFKKLLEVIWEKIQNLDFPDVSAYEKNLRGSLEFERDLLE
jgi:hypothetical protein